MNNRRVQVTFFILLLFVLLTISSIVNYYLLSNEKTSLPAKAASNQIIITEPPISGQPNLQLRTFYVITLTPSPTLPPANNLTPSPTLPPGQNIAIVTPFIGGPNPPAGYYCIDDENASGCDDNTAFIVPKGVSGAGGSCGTVIGEAHKIIAALPQDIKYGTVNSSFPEGQPRDRLNNVISNACHSTGPQDSGYLSTYLIIDAYNLAGYNDPSKDLSKTNPQHVEASAMLNWWKTASGYKFISYSPSVMQQFAAGQVDLTGCVMFLKFPSGFFPSIVNKFEVYNANGDGVMSVLMSNAIFYLDRFIVAGWNIQNTLEHSAGSSKPMINGIEGFGCHT